MLIKLLLLLVIYQLLRKLIYIRVSKYLTYSRITNSIYIDVIDLFRLKRLNRKLTDEEITQDFYEDTRSAIDNLKRGRVYTIRTHSVIKRELQKNEKIEIISSIDDGKTRLKLVNLFIGKKSIKVKNHRAYKIKFKVVECAA